MWRNGWCIPREALQTDLKGCQRSLLAVPLFLYPKEINRTTVLGHLLNRFQLVNWNRDRHSSCIMGEKCAVLWEKVNQNLEASAITVVWELLY